MCKSFCRASLNSTVPARCQSISSCGTIHTPRSTTPSRTCWPEKPSKPCCRSAPPRAWSTSHRACLTRCRDVQCGVHGPQARLDRTRDATASVTCVMGLDEEAHRGVAYANVYPNDPPGKGGSHGHQYTDHV